MSEKINIEIRILSSSLGTWLILTNLLEQKYTVEYLPTKQSVYLAYTKTVNKIKLISPTLELISEYKEEATISIITSSLYSLTMEELRPVFDVIEYVGTSLKNEIQVLEKESKRLLFTYKNNKWIL